ncbi:nucleotidyltransferase family protein [Actinokineospora sp. NBRC 105648]|uniref:nucleotidyltransferase family protein n=1 Tax=Actinokineospora sp. NBRC 105648 TaxID=3032206 RepID=UPI0024A4D35C|nr:nucleotidyltransferase family protein [Actinokineospora sp. NBRC 105648]GLZ40263.1 4-diphosphocytidyl-2C-methyl-D-erythritol synthase [Actinokineospora sp. NBRC 105648]
MAVPDVAGLLLAAGGGSRFGLPKALAPYRGALLVEHALGALADLAHTVVVLGAGAERVPPLRATVVINPDWATGMGSSLRVGLAALGDQTAVVVLPVDTPGITAAAVNRLAALATPDALVRATYAGVPGHPVLLGRAHWAGVAALAEGDTGARPYLARHPVTGVACDDVADGADADRPEELH